MELPNFPVEHWGQATLRLALPGCVVLTDPYLTDRVAELEGPALRRMRPAPVDPGDVRGVDVVLVSHDHLDHCDPATLGPLLKANPDARLLAPSPAVAVLKEHGITGNVEAAEERWYDLADGVRVRPVPAAHPDIDLDDRGVPKQLGFVLEAQRRRYYFAGDTSPHDRILDALRTCGDIHVAFLPVNERNYYRDRAGIIGNMSVREALRFAADIGVETLVPIHWDLFSPNCVYPEEIRLVHERQDSPFQLILEPEVL